MSESPAVQDFTGESTPRAIVRSLRISQWAKNAFLFVPLFTAHQWTDAARVIDSLLAFATLCLVASGTYLVNDLLDVEADRLHPTKRNRPLAAGSLSPRQAVSVATIMIGVGLALAYSTLSPASTWMLVGYLVTTLCYSAFLKERMLIDVIVLAGLYTYRILIGGVATQIPISPWLLAFSLFLFVSLALVKRYVELDLARELDRHQLARRAYSIDDIQAIFTMGLVSGYLSILVLCLYVSSEDVSQLYSHPSLLWAICPVMLYWVSRVWLLASRKQIDDDPVAFAIGDGTTYACVALLVAVAAISL